MRELFLYLLGVYCSVVWKWKGLIHATDKTFCENKGAQMEKGGRNRKGAPSRKRASKYSQILLALYEYVNMGLSSLTSKLYWPVWTRFCWDFLESSFESKKFLSRRAQKASSDIWMQWFCRFLKKWCVLFRYWSWTQFRFTVSSGTAENCCATESWMQWNKINAGLQAVSLSAQA